MATTQKGGREKGKNRKHMKEKDYLENERKKKHKENPRKYERKSKKREEYQYTKRGQAEKIDNKLAK